MSHKACGYGIDNVWFCTEGAAGRSAACKPCTLTTCPQYGTTHGHTPDMVDHPDHYKSDTGIECIDALRAALGKEQFLGFCRGNVIKYLWRVDAKGKPTQDAKKAEWYLKRYIAELEAKA